MNSASSSFTQFLMILSTGSTDLLFSLLCGLFCAICWGDYRAEAASRLSHLIAPIAFTLSVLFVVQLYILTGIMIGTSDPRIISPQLSDVLFSTHAGWTLLPQFSAAMLISAASKLSSKKLYFASYTFLLLFLSIFRSASGHASSEGNISEREFAQWIHLLSTGVWSGGVIVASIASFNAPGPSLRAAKRLSRQSLIAVILVILSGGVNTWFGLSGSLSRIPDSAWGRILLAKLILVSLALLAGLINRRLIQATVSNRQTAHLTLMLRCESVVMLGILFLSGWLATTSPVGD